MKRVSEKPRLLALIDRFVREGSDIDMDGAGSFALDGADLVFQPSGKTKVFIAYAKEDRAEVRKLYRALKDSGLDPWMDEQKLLPGQNWPRAIERAIEVADYVIVCFSRRSVSKRGFFHAELRYALDVAACVPLDEIFLVPVRLSECKVPEQVARKTQYIDLFPDWQSGVQALVNVLTRCSSEEQRKKRRILS